MLRPKSDERYMYIHSLMKCTCLVLPIFKMTTVHVLKARVTEIKSNVYFYYPVR